MQYLSAEKDGLSYVFKCAALYNGSAFYLLIYAAILVFIWIKGDREMKERFLYPAMMLLITVYNPLFPIVINKIFDINKEYYRFMWIAPVVLLIAAASVYVIEEWGKSFGQRLFIFAGVLLILAGAGSFTYGKGYAVRENIYGVPNEVLRVSRMIRSNTDLKYPVAIMDLDMNMEIRQYDPSILLSCDRTQYLDYIGEAEVDAQTAEKNEYADRLLSVIVRLEKPDKELFLEALDKTNTQFVVILKNAYASRYLTDAGLKLVGTTGSRMIFKYDLKDPIDYDLADYSEIWEAQFK